MEENDLYTKLFESFDERLQGHSADLMVVKLLLTIVIGDIARRRGGDEQAREYLSGLRKIFDGISQQYDHIEFTTEKDKERRDKFKRYFIGTFEEILGPIKIGSVHK